MASVAPERSAGVDAELVKVWFRFVPREGWLPYDTEGLWARPVGVDTARVANVPFLQDGVAEGDVVRFSVADDGSLWAAGRVEASDKCTIRVLPVPSGPLGRDAAAVHERFRPFGLGGESFSEALPLVAMTVPADADLAAIKQLLVSGAEQGWWMFEEGCVTDAWRDS
ncbi:DUF4265 domain-containing protein [Asanoa sp. NPDC050611]|uniref:DUF4265 domain-containing protein n=1 Tax=Asanoa sp. NPDC050611 TaxID=3157098 RepID=UPI0034088F31